LAQECLVGEIFAEIRPVGVVFGTRDGMPREQSAEALGVIFPESKIVAVRAGHLLPIEYPERAAEAIEKVFKN